MPTGHASLLPALKRVVLIGTRAERTDGQLLGAFLADRDADAFGLLVRRHGPMVLGVCRRVTGDTHVAEDAFQATFLVLARKAAVVRPREQVGNWLYGVAYRTALKARGVLARRRSREKQVDVMPEPPATHTPPEWTDLQPVIDEELAKLPEKLRGPVVLCDIEGRPQREVAKHLGVAPATLATRLAAARRTLAQRLTKRGVALSGGAVAGLLTIHGSAAAVPHALAHGLTRAAEAVATGGTVTSLVSASAVQLSEGVMRMMLLTKLKAVAVVAMTAIALTGGLGLGLVPAQASGSGDDPAAPTAVAKAVPAQIPPATDADKADVEKRVEVALQLVAAQDMDDVTFLRRLSLDLRGELPTDVEEFFFVDDQDANKRPKVVAWLVADDEVVREFAARELGVEVNRVIEVQAIDTGDGQERRVIVVDLDEKDVKVAPQVKGVAFSPDGKRLAVEVQQDGKATGKWVLLGEPLKGQAQGQWQDAKGRVIELKGLRGAGQELRLEAPATGFFRQVQQPGAKTVEGKRVLVWDVKDAKGGKQLFSVGDGKQLFVGDADGVVRVWDAADGKQVLWATQAQPKTSESDADFLKRAVQAARGREPSALEQKYFADDKDPKKREKLLDALLKEPEVQKKLGEDFKQRILGGAGRTAVVVPGKGQPNVVVPGKSQFQYQIVPVPGKDGVFELKIDPKIGGQKFEFKIDPKQIKPDGTGKFKLELDPKKFVPNVPNVPGKPGNFEFKFDPKTIPNFPGKLEFFNPKDGEWKFELKIDPKDFEKFKDLKEFKDFKLEFPKGEFKEFKFELPKQPGEVQGFKVEVPEVPGVAKGFNLTVPAQPARPDQPAKPPVVQAKPQPPVAVTPPRTSVTPRTPQAAAGKFEKLVGDLIAAKKTDEQILEALTLAAATRLPTATEKQLTLALVAKSADKKAAWIEVAKVLAGESKSGADLPVRVRTRIAEPPPAK